MADNGEVEESSLHGSAWEVPKLVDKEEGEEPASRGDEWEVPKPEDNEVLEQTPRGNEWEVVSLTASAYAAAPGPRGDESIHEDEGESENENDGPHSSPAALFLSGHFVFPPNEHENLPLVPDNLAILEHGEAEDVTQLNAHELGKSQQKVEEEWKIEGLNVPEEFPGIPLFDGKDGRLHDSGFDEATAAVLHELSVGAKEQDIYGTTKIDSFQVGTAVGGSTGYDENKVVTELVEPSDYGVDTSSVKSEFSDSGKGEHDDSGLPCGAWWKRGVASLCAQAKETSTFWSVFVAAAVMGLVLLGQRWQQERWQLLHQRWQLSVGDEKSGKILSRLKDVIVGGSRRGTYITGASAER